MAFTITNSVGKVNELGCVTKATTKSKKPQNPDDFNPKYHDLDEFLITAMEAKDVNAIKADGLCEYTDGEGDVEVFGMCVIYKGAFVLEEKRFDQSHGFIIRNERVSYAAECDSTTVLVMIMPADVLVISNFRVTHRIRDPQSGNDSKRFLSMLPGDDLKPLPFMISSGRESLNLINGMKQQMQILISGSSMPLVGQQGVSFTKVG